MYVRNPPKCDVPACNPLVRLTSTPAIPGYPSEGQESAQMRRPTSRPAMSASRRLQTSRPDQVFVALTGSGKASLGLCENDHNSGSSLT